MKFLKTLLVFTLLWCSFFHSYSAVFDPFYPRIIQSEGIYFVMIQYDRGGATKFGVTLVVYDKWCNKTKLIYVVCDKDKNGKIDANDLRLTTLNDMKPIYQRQYWDFFRLSEVKNQAVAEIISDMIINCGTGKDDKHIKVIQKYLGIQQDGIIGSKMLKKLNQANQSKLYHYIYTYRAGYYRKIGVGKQSKFLKGWLNRISKLKQLHHNEKYLIS